MVAARTHLPTHLIGPGRRAALLWRARGVALVALGAALLALGALVALLAIIAVVFVIRDELGGDGGLRCTGCRVRHSSSRGGSSVVLGIVRIERRAKPTPQAHAGRRRRRCG